METTPQNPTSLKEEVLGVSRSGRVRKKSSKLLDSVLMNEVEKKPKQKNKNAGRASAATGRGQGRPRPPSSAAKNRRLFDEMSPIKTPQPQNNSGEFDAETEGLEDDEDDDDFFVGAAEADSDDELDELVADIVEGVEAESIGNSGVNESRVRQSLYMTEKANKRKMLKDGKVVTGKMERKDKGKTRYTAYSLWAREFRKTSKFSKNQDLDFSNAAKRLGELWANVSNKEKNTWRRKAKVQATKAKAREKTTVNPIVNVPSNNTGFLNRATTSRTRKLAEQQKSPVRTSNTSPVPTKRKRYNSFKSNNGITTSPINNSIGHLSGTHSQSINSQITTTKIVQSNIEPIDAAAHLKLLGESLTIIGESLKEHDGQIASSGSLSVLLDSLLCSIGPLLCLTTHIPGLDKKPKLKENLSATLDNIAYVMPGL